MKESKPTGKIPMAAKGKKKHWISFRMDDKELIEFQRQLEQADVKDRTEFIKACLFNRPIKTVTFNSDIYEYWKMLSNFQAEYRSIGINYNQIVKVINSSFKEKQVISSFSKVQSEMIKLRELNNLIIELTEEVKDTWLQK